MSEVTQIRLVGRGAELKRLASELRALSASSATAPGLITIAGDPGIGKTRLLQETREILPPSPLQWVETSCAPHGAGHPWHPMRGLLQRLAGIEPQMLPEERLLRLAAMAKEIDLGSDDLDTARHLLALPTDGGEWPTLSASERRQRIHRAVDALIGSLGGDDPLALVFEDLHWIDPETMRWLDAFLLDHSGRSALLARPVTVIALHRPVFSHLWPAGVARADLRLDPLDARSTEKLLREHFHLSEDNPRSLIDRIVAQTSGNPFFVEEAVRLLKSRGSLATDPHGNLAIPEGTREIDLPATASGLVQARLHGLERPVREVLHCAAVIGPEVRLDLLRHMAGDGDPLDAALERLVEENLLKHHASERGPALVFRHSIIQEVTHASLMQRQARELHGKLALHLETLHGEHLEESAELLAHHFGASSHHSRAVVYLRLAAEQAKRLCSHEAAEHHLSRLESILEKHGHAIEDADSLRAWTVLERGRLARLAGDLEGACGLLSRGLESVGESTPLGIRLLRSWGETERQRGEAEQALSLHRRALAACDELSAIIPGPELDRERVQSLLALGVTQRVRGEVREALPTLEEARHRAAQLGDEVSLASALNNGGICRIALGDFHEAHAPLTEAVTLLRAKGDQRNLVGALINLGIAFDRLLELDRALDVYAEALRLAYELGHRRAILANHINAGQVLLSLDNQEEASRHFRRVIDHCRQRPDAVAEGLAEVNLGFSLLHRGDRVECAEALRRAERLAETAADHTLDIHCTLLRAEHALAEGDSEKAERESNRAVELAGEGDERPWALRLRGRALLSQEKTAGLKDLGEALRLARRRRDAREQIQTLTALSEAMRRTGRPLAARRHHRRAERLLARHPIPLLQRHLREVNGR